MLTGVVGGKKGAMGIASGLAAVGITPNDVTEAAAITIGMVVGVVVRIAADIEHEKREKLDARSRFLLLAYMLMGGTAAYALAGWLSLPPKALPFISGVFAFAMREWIGAIEQRGRKEIEQRKLDL